ncbi:MAG: hypothetical protein R6X29_08985 [Acidimicrobiia bacterium]
MQDTDRAATRGGAGPGLRGATLLVASTVAVVAVTLLLAAVLVPTEPGAIVIEGRELRPNQLIVAGSTADGTSLERDLVFAPVRLSFFGDGPASVTDEEGTIELEATWPGSTGHTIQVSGRIPLDAQVATGDGVSLVLSFGTLSFFSNRGECSLLTTSGGLDYEIELRCADLTAIRDAATVSAVGRLVFPEPERG